MVSIGTSRQLLAKLPRDLFVFVGFWLLVGVGAWVIFSEAMLSCIIVIMTNDTLLAE
jgi:hypothetical protein